MIKTLKSILSFVPNNLYIADVIASYKILTPMQRAKSLFHELMKLYCAGSAENHEYTLKRYSTFDTSNKCTLFFDLDS